MPTPLAILLPAIGALSESFLRRHAQLLLPGKTVVIAEQQLTHWDVEAPKLILDQRWPTYRSIRQRIRGKLGLRDAAPSWSDRRAAASFLTAHNVHVIMCEYLDYSCRWLPVAQELGIRFFAHGHGLDVSARLREHYWRQRYLELNAGGGIIAASDASGQRLISHGIEPAKVHVIPCGVDVPPTAVPHTSSDTVRCLVVGRMVAKKGPLLTLEAFKRAFVLQNNLRLDYVGSGPLLGAVEEFVAANGLSLCVTLHREKPNDVVHALMKQADIFVQHSLTDPATGDEEGLPVAILEAMAHALPVVATHHAGIPEAVIDQETGFLVAEGDVETMGARIVELARSETARAQLGRGGWERAREKFSWEQERRELLALLQLS
jgi:colanic acid/amylovoran biosynthesis glycosyltransferase